MLDRYAKSRYVFLENRKILFAKKKKYAVSRECIFNTLIVLTQSEMPIFPGRIAVLMCM